MDNPFDTADTVESELQRLAQGTSLYVSSWDIEDDGEIKFRVQRPSSRRTPFAPADISRPLSAAEARQIIAAERHTLMTAQDAR